jgi:hypothetical protein
MNESVTKAISKAVLDENAAILLWTGDMVNVNDTNADTLKNGLEKWRGIMEPLYSKVKIWPVRGNHGTTTPIRRALELWLKAENQ